jgi:hypothetical protein
MKTRGPASRRTTAKPDYGVFDLDKFWGQVLPHPAAIGGLEARVERAWRFMRNTFFTPEEHAAVAEAVARLFAGGILGIGGLAPWVPLRSGPGASTDPRPVAILPPSPRWQDARCRGGHPVRSGAKVRESCESLLDPR